MAFRGSVLGVGTDIAGSIRIPSLCCGVYGFKPSVDRIPFSGGTSGSVMKGVPGLKPSAGPLSNSFEDLDFFMRSVLGWEPWKYDFLASPVGWNTVPQKTQPLTIGVLPEDQYFPLHPPVRRAMESAIAKLQEKGHRIVRLSTSPQRDFAFMNRLAFEYFIYSPFDDSALPSLGEPPIKSVVMGSSPMFTGPMPVELQLDDPKNVFQVIDDLHTARSNVTEAWHRIWIKENLDVVLAPGAQNTAVPHDTYGWPPYTVIWNLMDVCYYLFFL